METPHAFTVGGEVFYDPHPGAQLELVQRVAKRVLTGEGPSKFFLRGNRGGGKSFTVRRGICHALALAVPGLKYAVVRRNMPDLRTNHLIYLGSEMRKLGGEWNETHAIAKYDNGSMGFYRQCEDERDVEKVVGAEVAILFVDEAPQIKWEYLRTMAPSLRVARAADGTQPYWTCEIYGGNPIGESIEDLDKYFVDQAVDPYEDPQYRPEDWCHVPMHRADNPSLDEAEYLKQFAGVPAHFRAAWIDGVRMDARTLFDVRPTKDGQPYHYIQELPAIGETPLLEVPWIQIYRAFDMGYFPDPAVCVWFAVVGRRVIAFREETWFRTIAKDLAARLQETTRELVGETPVVMTYADPQIDVRTGADAVTVRDVLEMAGVPIECSINDRVLYADAIHGLLGEEIEPGVPRLQIYEPGCPMLAKYLPKMRWDDKNPRRMADHKFDHWIVCLAYFAISSGVLSNAVQSAAASRPVWMDWLEEGGSRRRRVV
jgi:hypothetical protein